MEIHNNIRIRNFLMMNVQNNLDERKYFQLATLIFFCMTGLKSTKFNKYLNVQLCCYSNNLLTIVYLKFRYMYKYLVFIFLVLDYT